MRRIAAIFVMLFALISCEQTISDFQYDNFIKYLGSGSNSFGYDITELSDGGYIIAGFDNSFQFRKQALIARIDKAGNTIWNRTFGTEQNEEGRAIDILDGEILVAGNRTNYITGASEAFLLRVGFNGDSLNSHSFGGDKNIVLHHMSIHNNKIFIAGETYESNPQVANYYIACIDPLGELIWERTYGNTNGRQAFKRILFTNNGNIATVGVNNAITGSEFSQISYTELNIEGLPIGGLHLPLNQNQNFGDAISLNNDIFILYSAELAQSTNSHIASISEGRINWDINLGNIGRGTSITLTNQNSLLLSTSTNALSTFNAINFTNNGVATSVEELRTFPGNVHRTIKTSDGGIIAIGATSLVEGGMVRLIKTDSQLYLLNL